MRFSPSDLQREAAATGFSTDLLEKTGRLLGLLEAIRSHPFLGPRVALKGGTALNLFIFDTPRLSVDLDLNYVGALQSEVMVAERPKVDQAVQAVCGREALAVRRVPDQHAGGKWRLSYASAAGGSGNLELDMNFLLRTPPSPQKVDVCREFLTRSWTRRILRPSIPDEQIHQLIEIEAHELGLTHDEAMQKAKKGTLPTGPLGSDIEFLAGLFAA